MNLRRIVCKVLGHRRIVATPWYSLYDEEWCGFCGELIKSNRPNILPKSVDRILEKRTELYIPRVVDIIDK